MHVGPLIAVSDLTAARTFYEDQLGLAGSVGQPDLQVARLRDPDGNVLTVFSVPGPDQG